VLLRRTALETRRGLGPTVSEASGPLAVPFVLPLQVVVMGYADQKERPMVELGLAILFIGTLVALDRARRDQLTAQVREFLDWLERSS
jgi:hypothetical protein